MRRLAVLALLSCLVSVSYAKDDPMPYRAKLDYTPQVLNSIDGHDILTLGELEYLSVSPDFQTDRTIQDGVSAEATKLVHLEAGRIGSNYIGTTPPRVPRSEVSEEFPWVPVLMIDGDRSAGWFGGGFVRLDFPKETRITRVVIWPLYDRGPGFERPDWVEKNFVRPSADFHVQVARDAANWEVVGQAQDLVPPENGPAVTFEFEPVLAKQLMLVPTQLTWGIAELEVFDEAGNNVALVTRGTSVTVGGTNPGPEGRAVENNRRWPLHWILGTKWMRVGYWNDATNWHRVEREKGVLDLDPVSEAAIRLAHEKGVEVVLCLAYGNLLYEPDGRQRQRPGQGYTVSWTLPVPKSPDAIAAFAKYCAYMAEKFRGAVTYYEVWNEPDSPEINTSTPEQFSRMVLAASKAIREANPDAKVVLGGTGSLNTSWTYACLREGIADEIDVIAFHPYMMSSQPEDAIFMAGQPNYGSQLRTYLEGARALGFTGTLMANEIAWKANYPQSKTKDPKLPFWSHYDVTDLTKAKYLARTMLLHAAHRIPTFWNESWTGPGSLVRHGASLSPDASWYVMRTLATATDGLEPMEPLTVRTGPHSDTLETHWFDAPNGDKVLAIWFYQEGVDDWPGVATNITIPRIRSPQALGVDMLNGVSQQLRVSASDAGTVLEGIRLRDYPLLIRLSQKK